MRQRTLTAKSKVLSQSAFWKKKGRRSETILSTRIRLARNLDDMPFPSRMDHADYIRFVSSLENILPDLQTCQIGNYIDSGSMRRDELRVFRERNLVTREIELQRPSGYAQSDTGLTILVNDDDHIHIQALAAGNCAEALYQLVDQLDNELNSRLPWAFSTEFGFLTARIANSGTGLKVSYMMHLPLLTVTGIIPRLSRELQKNGLYLNSVEPGESRSGLYILGSGFLPEMSEAELLSRMDQAAVDIAGQEEHAREEAFSLERMVIEDRVARALGILGSCKILPYSEAMELLSVLRLGVYYSLVGNVSLSDIDDAMVWSQPGHLLLKSGLYANSGQPDVLRAQFVGDFLKKAGVY